MSTAKTATKMSLLLLAYFAFISLGLPDGLIGVGWPSMSPDLDVPLDAVGLLLVAGTTGYIASSVAAGFTLARLGVGRLLAGSTILASLALTGYATSPVLAMMIGCALVLGLGSGAIDSGLNAYAAAAFGPRHMNWMHAFFGLGVAIGPLIMTSVLSAGGSWRWGYAAVAAAQAVLATAFALTARNWAAHRPVADDAPTPPRVPIRDTLAIPAVWFGALAFAVYVAVEVAAGLWAFLLLTDGRGLSAAVAGVCVSGYWASLFLGRVVQGVVAERLGGAQVLRASLIGMVAGAVLVALPAPGWVTVTGLAVIGFAAAPVFPLMTLTTVDRVGVAHTDRAIGVQIGAAGLGGALLPGAVGVLLNRTDVEVLGLCLVALSVLLLVLYLLSTRRADTPTPLP
ncbi:MFS transporter [Actinomycetes bacterium KLBMP 9797]